MDTMMLSQWIVATTFLVAFAFVSITLIRIIRGDGYGTRTLDPRSDWGTPTVPSLPYRDRI
jgi:hypothetical protein